MTDVETLAERVSTVERAVTDGECEFPEATELADVERRLAAVEDRLDDLDERVDELDAATQAVRGYVGSVRSVNEDVEQRADTALAATERLERRLDEVADRRRADGRQGSAERSAGRTGREPGWASGTDSPRANQGLHGDRSETADSGTDDETDATPDAGVVERIRSLL